MAIAEIEKCLSRQEFEAVKAFRRKAIKEAGGKIQSVILFGSRARSEGNEDSDIDILVLLSKKDDKLKIKIWDIAQKIFCDTDISISPLVLSKEQFGSLVAHERLIAKNIQEEGIAL